MATLLIIQATYFIAVGIWPFAGRKSFLSVTGPKTDLWLVKTVSLLIISISFCQFTSIYFRMISFPVISLSIISAFSLMWINIYYSYNGIISNVYLVDAVIELAFLICWLLLIIGK